MAETGMETVPDPDHVLGAGGEDKCDANDRDDLEEDEDQEETTFHERIQRDLQHLIDEIRSEAKVETQNPSIDPVSREAEEKEVIVRLFVKLIWNIGFKLNSCMNTFFSV